MSKTYDFILWLLPKVEKFSRAYRFTVGERLSATSLDVLLLLVEAAYSTHKEELLHEATRKINSSRYLLRLAKDLRLLTVDSYGFAAERLDEIGRMVGGWRKISGEAGMKRIGNLWPGLISFENLTVAAQLATAVKRSRTGRGRLQPEPGMGAASATARVAGRHLSARALS